MKVDNKRSHSKSGRAQPNRNPGVVRSTGLSPLGSTEGSNPMPWGWGGVGRGAPLEECDLKMLFSPPSRRVE